MYNVNGKGAFLKLFKNWGKKSGTKRLRYFLAQVYLHGLENAKSLLDVEESDQYDIISESVQIHCAKLTCTHDHACYSSRCHPDTSKIS